MPGAGALGHHVQELALLSQAGEHGAHVPHGHVADTGRDGGQSQGAAWGGEAGGPKYLSTFLLAPGPDQVFLNPSVVGK